MKGFKKDGKFRPTENRKKSSLSKSDIGKSKVAKIITEEEKEEMQKELAKKFSDYDERVDSRKARSKESLDIPRSKLNYNKGLLTNEANELSEILELRKEDRERIHEKDLEMDKLTKKMFNIIFDFENGHNDDITMSKYNDLKLEFQNLLVEYEDARNERDQVQIGLTDDNKKLERQIDKVQDILFDIGN